MVSQGRKESIQNLDFTSVDAIILPVAGTNAKGEVDTIFQMKSFNNERTN